MRLRNLSLFIVLYTICDSSCCGNVESVVNFNLLSTMPTAFVRSVNEDLLNQFVHDLRGKFRDVFVLLHHLNASTPPLRTASARSKKEAIISS